MPLRFSALLCFWFWWASHGPRTSWIKTQKEQRAELRREGSGLAAAELSLSRRHLCRCNSVKHFTIKYWIQPFERISGFRNTGVIASRRRFEPGGAGGRHHRTISELTRMKLPNCVKFACSLCEKCETRWTHGLCTIPQNYQMNANTCCQLYLLTNINPSQMNY